MKQETDYSCGAFAVKICLKHLLGLNITEKWVRKICDTRPKLGTDSKGISEGLSHWKLKFIEHQIFSKSTFSRKFKEALASNHIVIISVHDLCHWIPILEMYNRVCLVIDSDFTNSRQYLGMAKIIKMAFQYDKFKDKQYFNFFEIWK